MIQSDDYNQKQAIGQTFNDFRDFTRCFQLLKSHNREVGLIVMNQDSWRRVDHLMRQEGYAPEYRPHGTKRRLMPSFAGVTICISDHIPTDGQADTAPIYFMVLGQPNGVFALVNDKNPGVTYFDGHREDSPFTSVQGFWATALASTTSHALVQLTNWSTSLT